MALEQLPVDECNDRVHWYAVRRPFLEELQVSVDCLLVAALGLLGSGVHPLAAVPQVFLDRV